jgi:NHL repeat-containing protein
MTFPADNRGGRARASAVALLAALSMGGLVSGSVPASADSVPVITTIAGGVGGPGPASEIPAGGCVVTYAGGSLYTQSSAGAIRQISTSTGHLSTVVGTGVIGPATDGISGPASNLEPSSCGIAVDAHGNLLFSDGEHLGLGSGPVEGNNLVRVLAKATGRFYGRAMTAGDVYTIAGDGSYGFSGDGGPATAAALADPAGLAVDQAGNVIVADAVNNRIRVIAEKTGTFYGQPMTAGDIYTVAGGGDNDLGEGGPAVKAELNLGPRHARFGSPVATFPGAEVRVDHQGNIVVADQDDNLIRVIAGSKGRYYGQAMKAGFIYAVAGGGAHRLADGGPATKALLRSPAAIAIDHQGDIVIADEFDQRIRVVAVRSGRFYGQAMKAGDIYTVAGNGVDALSGDGGPATKAALSHPLGVSVDGAGNIVISGQCTRLPFRRNLNFAVTQDCLRVVAASSGRFYDRAMKRGDIYAISGVDGSQLGDGGPARQAEFDAIAMFPASDGFASDPAGDLAIGDSGDARIRFVPAATGTFFGQARTAGHIYTIAGDGKFGYAGDGGAGTSAEISYPGGLHFDHDGNLLIADPANYTLRVLANRSGTFYGQPMQAGHLYTLAGDGKEGRPGSGTPAVDARLVSPASVTTDLDGNLVLGDSHSVRIIAASTGTFYGQPMTTGDIYKLATIRLNGAVAVAADGSGNLLVSDGFGAILIAQASGTFYGQAMTAGSTYPIAGGTFVTGSHAVSGVPATSCYVAPASLAVDSAGNLLLTDRKFGVVRIIARTSGTFYGISMVAGDIYTLGGGGSEGLGDGGPAIDAYFNALGVAVRSSGAIEVETAARIRQISS